ncbi:MAG: twin-arginine translocation signal domain-containing protein [Desulfobacteraceae bacterium]|nr:MAG: twin-arginine translocation signal domain-containing protein [Desulfobacteraceae bacterium]
MRKMDMRKSRRSFLKTAGMIGTGALLAGIPGRSEASEKKNMEGGIETRIPARPFGKTGVSVSMLSLGGVLDVSDQIVFRQAVNMGITYWDTAEGYQWGNNEKAIGKYFERFPEDREKIFLATKSGTSNPTMLMENLNQSLERMKTSYVDLFMIHHVSDAKEELTGEVRLWAEKMKANGTIRLFGFSTHKNMETCMIEGAQLGWIDGIMMSYNYRLMGQDRMKKAVEQCEKAGIGLTAMKTQAAFTAGFYSTIGSESDEALRMTDRFMKKGYTAEQAKLKAVWENKAIASICSAMPNMTILQANAAAALNQNELSLSDKHILNVYAQQTSSGYCAGCARICESAIGFSVPISDLFRHAMYKNSYGDRERAMSWFQLLPEETRSRIPRTDYSKAEMVCPQKIEIGKVIRKEYEAFIRPGEFV